MTYSVHLLINGKVIPLGFRIISEETLNSGYGIIGFGVIEIGVVLILGFNIRVIFKELYFFKVAQVIGINHLIVCSSSFILETEPLVLVGFQLDDGSQLPVIFHKFRLVQEIVELILNNVLVLGVTACKIEVLEGPVKVSGFSPST